MKQNRLWVLLLWAPLLSGQVAGTLIVELSTEPAIRQARRTRGRLAMAEARDRIRAEQQTVRTALEREAKAKVIASIDTVANALVVTAPGATAATLAASSPRVKRVYPDREVKLLLDHALPLQKIPDAWQKAGGLERAGLGAKIAIIDSGIDQEHPGFQDSSLPVPEGFPRANKDADLGYTNNKVIVARTYEDMLGVAGGGAPTDDLGHGTAVAMIAAGVPNEGPYGAITGVAPKAWIGNYKVFTGTSGTTRTSVILKAMDDAVKDGMDVINLSLGSLLASRPEDSIEAQAVESAAAAGVIVVASAGNEGPDPNTIDDFASAPSAIAVGASWNDRAFAASVTVEGMAPVLAVPGSASSGSTSVTGPVADAAQIDQNGLACAPFPGAALSGRIALILRGDCTFEVKLNNAQRAGAAGAIVYTDASRPAADFTMSTGTATLPAELVSYADGTAIKSRIAAASGLTATLRFTNGPVLADPNRLASFTSKGPNTDFGVKPDLVAVGKNVYTAAEKTNPDGMLFSASGYTVQSGTSFSSPMVAGAAAFLKTARPGLTAAQYRSLLVNTATPFVQTPDTPAGVQQAGAGLLNLDSALQQAVTISPVSLSFGVAGSTADLERDLTITNTGTAAGTFSIAVMPSSNAAAPDLLSSVVQLESGQSATIPVHFAVGGLTAGEYQGFLQIQAATNPIPSRVPYWYGVPSGTPAHITILNSRLTGTAGSTMRGAIYLRITDVSGIALKTPPEVTAVSGGGSVVAVRSVDYDIPGAFAVDVTLGPASGINTFEIHAGDLPPKQVAISGTRRPAAVFGHP